ncbi:MAG TPA: ribosome-associated translation inhibitor RaiA [Bryobacterales bacterium]|nr:ribosome-associated translation inhibitor RaiA [Bryobacterales bacterium]
MNIHYTSRQIELPQALLKKLDAKFQKIQKILGGRLEPEAHVILSQERRLHVAEVTLHAHRNTTVVQCSGPDPLAAVQAAADKLEKQIIRNKEKWREKKRRDKSGREMEAEAGAEAAGAPSVSAGPAPRRNGNPLRRRPPVGASSSLAPSGRLSAKPLTLEEAALELEHEDLDCVVYQDAEKGRLSVLFRRRDGDLELIEG